MALRIRMYYNLILRTGNSTCNNKSLLADAQRLLDYKCSYKSTQVRLITKYLGACTQAPHTDVLAKLMDTYSCTPQSFAQHPK